MNDVNLTGMHISDANLSELAIDGAQWGGAHFQSIGYGDPSQPDAEHNKEGVRFSDCSFQNGRITDCDFTNANFQNCDISGLVINGINIEELIQKYVPAEQRE